MIVMKTRSQVLVGYMIIMLLVMVVTFLVVFSYTSNLLRESLENNNLVIAQQINGRVNGLLRDIERDSLELLFDTEQAQ